MSLSSLSKQPRIDLLLPSKERFTPDNAGAIAGVVHDLAISSATPDVFHIYGTAVENAFSDVNFTGLKAQKSLFQGQNIGFANAYLNHIATKNAPDIVEVHSRCNVARHLAKKNAALNVILYLHNDPRTMKGAKTVTERRFLLDNMAAVICISDYIRACFLDGIGDQHPKAHIVGVARNGAYRWITIKPKKEPIILLAGRMVPEKGILECAEAVANVLPDFPEWRLVIAGARHFEKAKRGSYEDKIAKAIAPLGSRAEMLGFIPIKEMRDLQMRAAIAACPSLWNEPISKVVLESLAAGCALLTTRRGGIPEVAEGRALIVDHPNVSTFSKALTTLVGDDAIRQKLQDKAWDDFPFTASQMAEDADSLRLLALLRES
ncbi:glycosyltransferase family 4 protein [Alphaproteobacteria bacterium]|nr:glycosyltransferase family 4 protein [Alphaproteobacteria bacterium]